VLPALTPDRIQVCDSASVSGDHPTKPKLEGAAAPRVTVAVPVAVAAADKVPAVVEGRAVSVAPAGIPAPVTALPMSERTRTPLAAVTAALPAVVLMVAARGSVERPGGGVMGMVFSFDEVLWWAIRLGV